MKIGNLAINFAREEIKITQEREEWPDHRIFISWEDWPKVRHGIDQAAKLRFSALTAENCVEELIERCIGKGKGK